MHDMGLYEEDDKFDELSNINLKIITEVSSEDEWRQSQINYLKDKVLLVDPKFKEKPDSF